MKKAMFCVAGLAFLIAACVSSGKAAVETLSLDQAILASARQVGLDLQGRKVAVINFSSDSEALSEYVIEELSRALLNDKVVSVVERQQLDLVRQELDFNMTGEVSDKLAQSIGNMLGADAVITGSLADMGSLYRFEVRALNVENATPASTPGFDVGKQDERVARFLGGQAVTASQPAVNTTNEFPPASAVTKAVVATPQKADTAEEHPLAEDGPVPEGLEYEVVDGKSVTISDYTGSAASIAIPARIQELPVTAIGEYAFEESRSLTSINIPSSVTTIGDGAFSSCMGLTSISIPSSVTAIGMAPFYDCPSLTSIRVDQGNSTFASVDGVLFDRAMRTILAYPSGKKGSSYTIPSSVTAIGKGAFVGCSLTSISIPSSVTAIGDLAFLYCSSLTSINIPSSVTAIGERVFYECSSLTSISIPSSVTVIGEGTFGGCSSLTSINIPSSVTAIGRDAFGGCSSLTSINIPSSVTVIEEGTFDGCSSLTSISIPSSVTAIGDWAFYGCSSLSSVTLSRRTQVEEDTFPDWVKLNFRD